MAEDGRTDEELFRAWCEGDRKSGHALFVRHFGSMRRFFANKADDDVEDLVQRTFMACVESRARFEQRSSFRTYLFGIARNILREHFRRRGRDGATFDPEAQSVCDSGAGPSTIMAAREEQRLMLAALRRIPLEHQILLELYFWERLTARRIAEIFELPENTIRSRIRRGRRLLSEQLEKLAGTRALRESVQEGLDDWAESLRGVIDTAAAERG